ncbi:MULTISPECIES: AfsR/SARP family transcriptional regulator [unclassified Crossiella]|uniref:AfsR/SARP family transcriptional regulator n=1 Tax=unclassified Crossiella TaxID=2620835 RepID=UPI001FFFBE60|nr:MULTISPECIES: AfsR/SARP family transcriptional regulator [unclassified Crossiella]MCK2241700.1 winged helix-turn-helix domain-containing protein [Crossiella sp. S99.2]MCK2255428.1 winged helix-turn-helix domain-containing protein [Crossiella sp. S99.1]
MGTITDLRLLGELEVHSTAGPVNVSAGKLQVLLAALLLHANQTVPADRLVAVLWEQPTVGARATLHVYIGRLRRVLGGGAEGLLRTRADGYSLVIEPELLDLYRFRRLVEQAAGVGDVRRENELLRRALELWRGPALAGVPSVALRRTLAAGLEEERLRALERRIETDLELGRHGDLVAELFGLTRDQPLREAFHQQLMLALYRSGRQTEALAAYRVARDLLVRELGLEPGAGLSALHQAILRGDPLLARPMVVAVPVPRELPRDNAALCGRAAELAELTAALPTDRSAGLPVVAITGPPGCGKTALAVRWAHRVGHRFPDGHLFLDLHGYSQDPPLTAAAALARLLRAFGIPLDGLPADVAELAARYRSVLHDRRVLLVLDNARDAEHIRPLLPGAAGCLVVVTSRDRLRGLPVADAAAVLPLGPLTAEAGRELLGEVLGAARLADEPQAVADLVDLCGQLPLALRIAAVDLAGRPGSPIGAHVAALRGGDRLGGLALDGDPRSSVRAAFDLSYTRLAPPARRLFRLTAIAPVRDLTATTAAAIAGLPIAETQRLLDILVAAHLVEPDGPHRFGLPDLLREYAAGRALAEDTAAQRKAAAHRLLDCQLHSARIAARLLFPDRPHAPVPDPLPGVSPAELTGAASATRWLAAECGNLVTAIAEADGHGLPEYAGLLAGALRDCDVKAANAAR